jgi:type IV pilus assembly protein PilQ
LGAVTPGASRIAFGLISLSDFMLDLELSAVQADGYGEVISTPKVMTADKQSAKIESGTTNSLCIFKVVVQMQCLKLNLLMRH